MESITKTMNARRQESLLANLATSYHRETGSKIEGTEIVPNLLLMYNVLLI